MSSDSQPPEDNAKEVATIKEPGARLRKLREDAGIDLNAISATTLVPVNKLVALENGDLEKVGGSAYVTGYARNYARALKVDPDPIVKSFEALLGDEEIPVADAGAFGDRIEPRKTAVGGIIWGSIVLILAVLALAAYLMIGSPSSEVSPTVSETPVIPAPSQFEDSVASTDPAESVEPASDSNSASEESLSPVQDDVEAPESIDLANEAALTEPTNDDFISESVQGGDAVAQSDLQLVAGSSLQEYEKDTDESLDSEKNEDLLILKFSGDCWVEVRDANGERKIAQLARSGDNLQLFGQAPFDIMMGNVRAVEILLNGVVVPINPRAGRNTLRVQVGSSR